MARADATVRWNTLVLAACLVPYAAVWQLVISVAPLAAERLTGGAALAGLAISVTVLGSALSPLPVGRFMDARGRVPGISLGFLGAAAGAAIVLAAILTEVAVLLFVGLAVFGFGAGAIFLTRVAAADMVASDRRATAVGRVLIGTAIGAVVGALIFIPLLRGRAVDAQSLALPWILATGLLVAGAALVWLIRTDPLLIARRRQLEEEEEHAYDRRGLAVIFAHPGPRSAMIAAAAAQLAMAGSMPMMGLELHHRGHDLGDVSFALAAHLVGMYALAPVSGVLVDRIGHARALVAGLLVLGTAVLGLLAADLGVIVSAMFFVGVGWNIAFVGATTLVADGTRADERASALGAMDLVAVTAGALGAAASTPLLGAFGVATVVAIAVAATTLPALAVALRAPSPAVAD